MEAWRESLIDCIKSIEEAQRDRMMDIETRNELDEVVVKIQKLIED